jgi:type I restriction enzyme S subunit
MKSFIVTETADSITKTAVDSSATKIVPQGSLLLVVRSGILRRTIPVAVAGRPLAINQDIKALIPRSGINSRYLAYYFVGHETEILADLRKQGSTVESLEQPFLANQMVPQPPTNVQGEVADFLDRETARIDGLIGKKERLIELLDEKLQAVIARAVHDVRSRSPQDCVKRLSSKVTSGSRAWAEYYSDTGALFLRIGNLSAGHQALRLNDRRHVRPPSSAELSRTRVEVGDVLVSITAVVGMVGVIDRDLGEAYISQHICLVRPRPDRVLPKWLGYFLLSAEGQQMLRAHLYGGTKEGLGLDDVGRLLIPEPSVEVQTRVALYLDRIDAELNALRLRVAEGVNKLREYRTALISAAVTGQIDVRTYRKEPEAVLEAT